MSQESLAKKKGIADIVFLIDISGSMGPCLEALKSNIGTLVDFMVKPGANASASVSDWRIKVCGYSDFNADGANWWEERPFSRDVSQVRSDLASLSLKGGGDEPESLLDGLWKVAKMPAANKGESADENSWRYRSDAARVVVVFSDASFHLTTSLPEASGATFDDVANAIQEARLRLQVYAPNADCYMDLSSVDKCKWINIGDLSNAVEAMKEFTANTANFTETLKALAKTITQSVETPAL
jgi:hypothetical protein